MQNLKKRGLLSIGRKWVFTLALFLLVFALSCVMKIHAGTSDSGSGWLWGGGAGPNDGTNTNVGWISINNTNQGGATNYGLNIPSGTGAISGYAWSENIGWISFNAADTAGCPQGSCNATKVAGNNIKGWARILGIRDALAQSNSGGWQGWISLSGAQYGVKINADNTLTGYGWSDELGWIDFSRAKYEEPCTLVFEPASKTVDENTSGIQVTLKEVPPGGATTCNSGTVTLSKNNSIVSSLSSSSPSPFDFSSSAIQSVNMTLGIGSVNSDTNFSDALSATSDKSGSANFGLYVKNVPVCTISAPSSWEITAGNTDSYDVTVEGESGCALDSCVEGSDPNNAIVSVSKTGSSCQIEASSEARYGAVDVTARASGGQTKVTKVVIKGPGWVETNP
ncbi:MAG: hypothetical protein PHP25_05160 [Candidatus Moranbacteria bacterium]|nr:hypothetical protein [Candidatus Moranbacteria bacterium]